MVCVCSGGGAVSDGDGDGRRSDFSPFFDGEELLQERPLRGFPLATDGVLLCSVLQLLFCSSLGGGCFLVGAGSRQQAIRLFRWVVTRTWPVFCRTRAMGEALVTCQRCWGLGFAVAVRRRRALARLAASVQTMPQQAAMQPEWASLSGPRLSRSWQLLPSGP